MNDLQDPSFKVCSSSPNLIFRVQIVRFKIRDPLIRRTFQSQSLTEEDQNLDLLKITRSNGVGVTFATKKFFYRKKKNDRIHAVAQRRIL